MPPLEEIIALVHIWIDSGQMDPRLAAAAGEQIARVPLPSLAEMAAAEADLVGQLSHIPGGVQIVRAWVGRERLAVLASLAPADALRAVDAVVDYLLRQHPAHGLVLFAHRDWALRLVLAAAELLAGSAATAERNVINFMARKRAKP